MLKFVKEFSSLRNIQNLFTESKSPQFIQFQALLETFVKLFWSSATAVLVKMMHSVILWTTPMNVFAFLTSMAKNVNTNTTIVSYHPYQSKKNT